VSEKILLVEDEELVGTMVRLNLESAGYHVAWLRNGSEGAERAAAERFDLILLDIGLPGLNGLSVLRGLRKNGVETPVMLLTARSDVPTKVEALEIGADDYLPKPFDVAELLARVNAVLRRSRSARAIPSDQLVRVGEHGINLETRRALSSEGEVTLGEKEAALVRLLVRSGGKVLTRSDILDEVWGMDATPSERTVDNYIVRLRKLFEPDPENPIHILTVRGEGYRFVP
jgi:two-component system alkaline phosphatase synthesis response regulator PhoP